MTTPQQPQPPSTPSGSYQNGGGSFGRDLRLVTGFLCIVGNLVLIGLDIYNKEPVTAQDVILHGALLVTGAFLMDPKRTLDLVSMVKDRIPFIGGGGK